MPTEDELKQLAQEEEKLKDLWQKILEFWLFPQDSGCSYGRNSKKIRQREPEKALGTKIDVVAKNIIELCLLNFKTLRVERKAKLGVVHLIKVLFPHFISKLEIIFATAKWL